jgi:hypothetical protein
MRARDREEGLRSEALREALGAALAGKIDRLEDLLCRYGGGADPRPNLRLAAAFGAEIGTRGATGVALLAHLAGDDADPETPRVFLPIAAVYGYAAHLRDRALAREAWTALGALAGDERAPVRLAAIDALRTFALGAGGAAALLAAAEGWLAFDDLEARFSAAAVVVETLADRRLIAALSPRPELRAFFGQVLDELAQAPRSAQRLESRRRLLASLPRTLALVVATPTPDGRGGEGWFEDRCVTTDEPELRAVLSDTILRLREDSAGVSAVVVQRLRDLLKGSAKPLRDPTRLRPGTGRGKASRSIR